MLREKGEYETLKRDLASKQKEIEILQSQLKEKTERIEKNAEREIENSRVKARQIIEKARREATLMLEELKKQKGELDKISYQRMRSAIRTSAAKLGTDELYSESKPVQNGTPLENVTVGQTVLVSKMSKTGTVESITGNSVRVNCGGLVISCKLNELFSAPKEKTEKNKYSIYNFIKAHFK